MDAKYSAMLSSSADYPRFLASCVMLPLVPRAISSVVAKIATHDPHEENGSRVKTPGGGGGGYSTHIWV